MDREPVNSKALVSIGYDEEGQTLEIEFKNGRVYQYFGVSRRLYDWLLRVPDKGGLFQRMIRDQYEEVDVTPHVEQDLLAALRASVNRNSGGDGSDQD